MLVLTRKLGEKILIGDDIVISVVDIGTSRLKLGIQAPGHTQILRSELDPSRSSGVQAPQPCGEDAPSLPSKQASPSHRQWGTARVEIVGA